MISLLLFSSTKMNTNVNCMEGGGEKRLSETSGSGPTHGLATIQSMQGVQNIVQSSVQTIQPAQSVIGTIAGPSTLVGKSVSVDINPKLSLMKPIGQAGALSSTDTSKITTTVKRIFVAFHLTPFGVLKNGKKTCRLTLTSHWKFRERKYNKNSYLQIHIWISNILNRQFLYMTL